MPGTTTARRRTRTAATPAGRVAALAAALGVSLIGLAGCGEYEGDALPGTDVGLDPDAVDGAPLDPVDVDADPDVADPDVADPGDGAAGVDADGDPPADDDPVARPFGPVDVPGDTRNIAGLYDGSVRRPLGVDTRYVLITADGTLVVYDYDQDPYGTGLNCYRAGAPLPLVRERGDDYLLDGRSVRIARETLGIGFGFTDTLDDDRDGDATEFLYYRYPRTSGLSVTDLNVCR